MTHSVQNIQKILEDIYDNVIFIEKGGFSYIFYANDKITKEKYAIKSVENEKYNEYLILSKLSNAHKHIICLKERIVYKNYVFYIFPQQMGYKNMTRILFNKLSDKIKVHIALQICDAVRYLHENNILHLDVKNKNILIDDEYNVLLIDFGNSILIDSNIETDTEIKNYFNENTKNIFINYTPNFASPELCEKIITMLHDMRISEIDNMYEDIYCVGVTLYYIFSGNKQPFEPDIIDGQICKTSLYMKIINDNPNDFKCDKLIKEMIFKMLDKNPINRPPIQCVIDFFSDLQKKE